MKYIIDIDDDLPFDPQFLQLIGTEYTGTVRIRHIEFDMLEELTSDYINKNFGSLQDEAMNKAWEAAQKVVCKTTVGDMSLDTLQEIFGVRSPAAIMQSNTAQQAIDKIKSYEQKQDKRDIESDLDYLMQSTGMTIDEIATGLKRMVE